MLDVLQYFLLVYFDSWRSFITTVTRAHPNSPMFIGQRAMHTVTIFFGRCFKQRFAAGRGDICPGAFECYFWLPYNPKQ